jgi:hypothetical protein
MREPAEQLRQRKAEDQAVESDEIAETVQCRSPRALVRSLLGQARTNVERGERRPASERAAQGAKRDASDVTGFTPVTAMLPSSIWSRQINSCSRFSTGNRPN